MICWAQRYVIYFYLQIKHCVLSLFLPPSAQERNMLDVWHQPSAHHKHKDHEQQTFSPVVFKRNTIGLMKENVKIHEWIVSHEVNHTVFTDITNKRYASERHRE